MIGVVVQAPTPQPPATPWRAPNAAREPGAGSNSPPELARGPVGWVGAGRPKPTRAAKLGRKPQNRFNHQLAGRRTTPVSKSAPCLFQAQYQAFRIASRPFKKPKSLLDSGIWTVLKRWWWWSQW